MHALGTLAETNLYIDDSAVLSVPEIRAKCRRLQSEVGLDLIVVDYLQLLHGNGRTDTRANEIGGISRALKELAREVNVPVIAAAQLSRAVESRNPHIPMLSDLRESGSIEQDADVVMFIYRDDVYNVDSPDRGTAEILVSKHRNGPTGMVRLAFLDHYTKFANMARGA